MVALALMVSCMPSAYTISASEAFGDGTEDIFTDGEITSEPAAEESTQDVSSADQEETEQAQQLTLTYENDSVKVTAEALEDGALPQNTALKADSVNENSSVSYDTVSQKLSAAATDKGSSLRGFFAYDVYFADGDGNRVEPNGRVRVTFEYKTPAAPELTDAASTSVTVEKLHYNSSTGDTDVNTLQANEDLKVLNVNEGKQIQTLQVETGNAAVFAVMWDSPETADVEAEAVSGNGDEVSIASEELTDGMDISDEPEQDAAETPAAENPEVTPEAEPSEAPAENPDAEPTEAPAEDPDVVEEPAEDIASPEEVPAADENGETSLIEVLGDDTNLRVSPSIEAEVLATVNAGTQLTLLDTVTAEDGATWYKVSWEGTEAYIRSDMAQVVDSSDEAEEPEDVQEEEIQPEITRYDYTSDEVNVKVTLTDPADLPDDAKLSVTPVELSQEAEDQITEEAIKEKKAIEKIHSYDIKFLVDGEEVQPGASVKVSVSLNDEKKIKDADVYHVDKNDNVENMDGSVAKNGDVEFETTHFSTYVIVQKGNNTIHVTVKYCDKDGNEIYAADSNKELSVGDRLKLKELDNWNVTRVVVNPTNSGNSSKEYTSEDTDVETSIELAESATVTAYYEATTGTKTGDPIFFDYTIKVKTPNGGNDSINNPSNYSKDGNKLTAGGYRDPSNANGYKSDNYRKYTYMWADDKGQYPNSWIGFWDSSNKNKPVTGLLSGVNKADVNFNYADPGFFTQTDLSVKDKSGNTVYLRKVYTNYVLNFDRTGDTYKLSNVQVKDADGNKTQVANAGAGFFPLDSVGYQKNSNVEDINNNEADSSDSKAHNYFFGLRYDIDFKLGDYIGDLEYKFTGDDDLWVVLDGKTVVIDLGGIHDAADGKVDLWTYLLNPDQKKEDLTDEQKDANHTLTVLYMERGAGASNCNMEFTLPHATISQVTTDPLGTLELQKVNSNKDQGLNGARFTLYGDSACTNEIETAGSTTVGNVDGKVIFRSKLREGTYYLKETQAPDGYVRSTERWTVEVTKKSDMEVSVTLKDSSGHSVEDNKIVNQTKQEFIDSNMEYNKTVNVDKWDKRTYNINITASSKTTSSSVVTTGGVADVVMALDVSGSMARVQTNKNNNAVYTYKGEYKPLELDVNKVYYYSSYYYSYYSPYYSYYSSYYTYPLVNIRGEWKYYSDDWKTPSSSGYVYTCPSRMTALKEVVNKFIKDTAVSSPTSKIGLAAFNTGVTTSKDLSENVENAETDLLQTVSKLKADGGTSPSTALSKAYTFLTNVSDQNLKYVILFTDGRPTADNYNDVWSDTEQKEAEKYAEQLKQKSIKIFTIGFALDNDNDAKKFLAGDDSGKYPGIASEDCAFDVNNADDLAKIFEKIQHTVTEDTAIQNATITDVIDPRFVILDEKGNAITADQLKDGKTVKVNGGTVYLDAKGNQCIKWERQRIPNKKENKAGDACWSGSIKVKAKDDYIGGNNVPTNVSPDSKISTGYGDAILPQPSVNVKLLSLDIGNDETTVFKGDQIDPTGYKDKLAKTLKVKELDGTTTITGVNPIDGKSAAFPTLSSDQKEELLTNATITLGDQKSSDEKYPYEYIYPGTTDAVGYFTYTYKVSETPGGNMKPHKAATVGNAVGTAVEKYELVVTYHPYSQDERKNILSGTQVQQPDVEKGGTQVNSNLEATGNYVVKVVAGNIQIIKKLDVAAEKDETFNFTITDANNQTVATATATFTKGEKEATAVFTLVEGVNAKLESDNKKLSELSRGDYKVVESLGADVHYELQEIATVDRTNCHSVIARDQQQKATDITFTMGTDTGNNVVLRDGNNDVTNGQIGIAKFTNKKIVVDIELEKVDSQTTDTKLSGAEFALYKVDTSGNEIQVNSYTSGQRGKISIENLPIGQYVLRETKAPTGYVKSAEPWNITVANDRTITVKYDGKDVTPKSDNNKTIYQITNTKVYSLPNSGGPGTYGFTISGVAILATALLLFINNKRREEEAKRS